MRWLGACAGLAAWMILLSLDTPTIAGQPAGPEQRIRDAALRLERAMAPLREAEATARLAAAFGVSARSVTELRDQKLALGDVAVVLALAETGRTSPDTILSLWASGRLNWGEIADRLNVEQRSLLRRLEAARRHLTSESR